ncbi:hypothetical protein BD779DRAFT_1561127 [Infundibulicybe gibba]|nr:hypothetical protein BD779DRAFT_1561127 [Infundibulicybe gibba]
MNPSRTYTPRGAIGIAGPVAAIYPVESPGAWQTPWLLESFDQVIKLPSI